MLGWESCDYTGPVHEDDTLCSELHIESPEPTDQGGVLGLRSLVYAVSDTAGRARPAGAGLAVQRPAVLQPGA